MRTVIDHDPAAIARSRADAVVTHRACDQRRCTSRHNASTPGVATSEQQNITDYLCLSQREAGARFQASDPAAANDRPTIGNRVAGNKALVQRQGRVIIDPTAVDLGAWRIVANRTITTDDRAIADRRDGVVFNAAAGD